jgi:hypothetical protein
MASDATRPWYKNVSQFAELAAGTNTRWIITGDSLVQVRAAGGSFNYDGLGVQLIQVGALGHVRAFQLGQADTDRIPVRVYIPSGDGDVTYVTVNRDGTAATKAATLAPQTLEYCGVPTGIYGFRTDNAGGALPATYAGQFTLSQQWAANAAHPAWEAADSNGVGVRLLYYAPLEDGGSGGVTYAGTLSASDNGGATIGTFSLATDARDYPGLATLGGVPAKGYINAVDTDYYVSSNMTAATVANGKSLVVKTPATFGTANRYVLWCDPIFYHANGSGASPTRVAGNYTQIMGLASYAKWNFVLDDAADATYAKSDTSAAWLRFLGASTLDLGHQPVIVIHCDTEFSEGSAYAEPGYTMASVVEYRTLIESIITRFDALFAAMGAPLQPKYWFIQPAHHWHDSTSGFGQGTGDGSKDNAANAERHNRLLEAQYQVAMANSRFGYTSLFAALNGKFPFNNNGSETPGVDAEVITRLDELFGADWVPPGTTYTAYTPGTGGDGGQLFDSLGLHPKSHNAYRAFAWLCKYSTELGDNGGGAARNRSRSRARAGSF